MRKCSICKRRGHTKRVCSSLHTGDTHHSPTAIPVKTRGDILSLHSVHLQKMHRDSIRDILPVFTETQKGVPVVRELSLASFLQKLPVNKPSHAHVLGAFKPMEEKTDQKQEDTEQCTPSISRGVSSKYSTYTSRASRFFCRFHLLSRMELSSVFAIVLAVSIVLPFPVIGYVKQMQDDSVMVVSTSRAAFSSLSQSTVYTIQSRLDDAERTLQEALGAFARAEDIIDSRYGSMLSVASYMPYVGKRVAMRESLLSAGHSFAIGNTYLLRGIGTLHGMASSTRAELIATLKEHLFYALPYYDAASESLAQIDSSVLPEDERTSFEQLRLVMATLTDDLHDAHTLLSLIEEATGGDGVKRYIIFFQNSHEIRATGGFWGSYAEVTVGPRTFSYTIPSGGTYDLQGQLPVYMQPPLPLQIVNARWEFQDLNWSPDFPTSAALASEWYRKSRGVTVDGVISVNGAVLAQLLSALSVSGNDTTSTAKNQNILAQMEETIAAAGLQGSNDPKKIIGDMAGSMLNQLEHSSGDALLRVALVAHQSLSRKDIQIWFADDAQQKIVSQYSWDGSILPTKEHEDYLFVVNSNVGGEKSDARIAQQINKEVSFAPNGTATVTLTITRSHAGTQGEARYGVPNINYLRVYVPEGSEIVSAEGFSFPPESAFAVPPATYEKNSYVAQYEQDETFHIESGTRVTKEYGKTVFGNWIVTYPGSTSTISFSYILPFTFSASNDFAEKNMLSSLKKDTMRLVRYTTVTQRQSGAQSSLHSQFVLPIGWHIERPKWSTADDAPFISDRSEEFIIRIPQ